MKPDEKKPKPQISDQQRSRLVKFMELNPKLVSGKLDNSFTKFEKDKAWDEVTETLNAMLGATKNKKEWIKSWADIKRKVKDAVAQVNAARNKTGNVSDDEEVPKLTAVQERVREVLGPIVACGHVEGGESMVDPWPDIQSTYPIIVFKEEDTLDDAADKPTDVESTVVGSTSTAGMRVNLLRKSSSRARRASEKRQMMQALRNRNKSQSSNRTSSEKVTNEFCDLARKKLEMKEKMASISERRCLVEERRAAAAERCAAAEERRAAAAERCAAAEERRAAAAESRAASSRERVKDCREDFT